MSNTETVVKQIDKYWVDWVRENQKEIIAAMPDRVRSEINTFDDLMSDLVQYAGWPSKSNIEPYFEELQHIINDCSDEYGVPIYPPEVLAYNLSRWTGTKVSVDHPLIVDNQKWLEVYYASEYDMAKPADIKQLYILIFQIAKGELRENMGSFQDLVDHIDSPDVAGQLRMTIIDGEQYWMSITDEAVAFMNNDEEIKVFTYDGERLYKDQDLPKVRNYIVGGMRASQDVTSHGELSSLIGNKLAEMVSGNDGISILDLP